MIFSFLTLYILLCYFLNIFIILAQTFWNRGRSSRYCISFLNLKIDFKLSPLSTIFTVSLENTLYHLKGLPFISIGKVCAYFCISGNNCMSLILTREHLQGTTKIGPLVGIAHVLFDNILILNSFLGNTGFFLLKFMLFSFCYCYVIFFLWYIYVWIYFSYPLSYLMVPLNPRTQHSLFLGDDWSSNNIPE